MSGEIDILKPDEPTRVVILASNPAVSGQTGWPIGLWWAELTHPYWEFAEHGYRVEIASPEGGRLEGDSWSDPRDKSRYAADDLVSLGFINSSEHMRLVEESLPLAIEGKTWTGLANSEENYADAFVGQQNQLFRIEEEAGAIENTNFIVSGRFKPHAVRDGILITGQQQYSAAGAARLIIQALGQ
jgi:putative intracellular protease/amidase